MLSSRRGKRRKRCEREHNDYTRCTRMNETENEFGKLLNQQVAVFKVDGFVKRGQLIAIFPNFVKLRFYNGSEELVPLVQISSIRLDGNAGARA